MLLRVQVVLVHADSSDSKLEIVVDCGTLELLNMLLCLNEDRVIIYVFDIAIVHVILTQAEDHPDCDGRCFLNLETAIISFLGLAANKPLKMPQIFTSQSLDHLLHKP